MASPLSSVSELRKTKPTFTSAASARRHLSVGAAGPATPSGVGGTGPSPLMSRKSEFKV